MRPAITEVRIFDEGASQKATVVGPIDLEAPGSSLAESDVYLWTRVSHEDPHSPPSSTTQAGEAAEAMGADEMDLDQVVAAAGATTTATGPAMWKATVPVNEGAFSVDDRVFVEVWALIRTKSRQREFQVYWYDTDVPVVQGTAPAQSSTATTATA
jgi:hypothetical protein